MSNIVNLGEFRVTRVPKLPSYSLKGSQKPCNHRHFTLDDNGHVVMCDDCGMQIDAYFALSAIAAYWGDFQHQLERKISACKEAEQKTIHLRSARVVERAWRDKRMVPICPHCKEGISPNDGFGSGAINIEMDNARRKARAQAKLLSQQTNTSSEES